MKKAALILLIFICFQQRVYLQNIPHSKLQFTSKEKSRVFIDSDYHYRFSAIDSSGKAFAFSVEGLPSWIHFDSSAHAISGKPPKPGQYPVHIVVSTADTMVYQRFMLTVYDGKTVNILTLGNSITNGTDKYNSYRRVLWQMLHKGNYDFDFIGSWNLHHMGGVVPEPDFDMDHDGHSGWKASDILNPPDWDKQRGNLSEWISTYTPDIVLLELGTNEVFQCISPKDAMNNISLIIDILRKKNPHVKIFVAQIPPLGAQWADKKLCGDNVMYKESIMNFNKQVALFVAAKNSMSSPVIVVDQYTGVKPATDMYDDIHPNEIGEKNMAERWYNAIHKYLTKLKG